MADFWSSVISGLTSSMSSSSSSGSQTGATNNYYLNLAKTPQNVADNNTAVANAKEDASNSKTEDTSSDAGGKEDEMTPDIKTQVADALKELLMPNAKAPTTTSSSGMATGTSGTMESIANALSSGQMVISTSSTDDASIMEELGTIVDLIVLSGD